MAIINLTIDESEEQIVSGIPKTISITSNIPSSIFYTLDGSIPTLFSNIYTETIFLPFNKLSITLNIFATNGVDSSPIITEKYITNILNNARLPHSATNAEPNISMSSPYPFGTNPIQPVGEYLNPGNAGVTVNNPDLPLIPSGFNSNGDPNSFTNKPFTTENYNIVYSTTNSIGQPGVGNLPASVKIENEKPIPETTDQFSNFFDPRAFVIFQDFSKENPNDPVHINRQFFTIENPERSRDGNAFFTSGLDAPPVNGSFLRSHYNPRDNTMTYYYLDTWTNKWIISKTPYQPTGTFDGNLSGIALSNKPGAGFVFTWQQHARRVLF